MSLIPNRMTPDKSLLGVKAKPKTINVRSSPINYRLNILGESRIIFTMKTFFVIWSLSIFTLFP